MDLLPTNGVVNQLALGAAIEYHVVHVTYELIGRHIAMTAITPLSDKHHRFTPADISSNASVFSSLNKMPL